MQQPPFDDHNGRIPATTAILPNQALRVALGVGGVSVKLKIKEGEGTTCNRNAMFTLPGEWGTLSLTKKHVVLLSLRGACVPERFLYQWRLGES